MNITELKELAEAASNPARELADMSAQECMDYGAKRMKYRKSSAPAVLELITQLEDAQGEIRALRATEAGLRDQLAALEKAIMDAEPVAYQRLIEGPYGDFWTVDSGCHKVKECRPLYTLNGIKKP